MSDKPETQADAEADLVERIRAVSRPGVFLDIAETIDDGTWLIEERKPRLFHVPQGENNGDMFIPLKQVTQVFRGEYDLVIHVGGNYMVILDDRAYIDRFMEQWEVV